MTDTIETLSGHVWPQPDEGLTSLGIRGTEARRVPLSSLTGEHLRVLLGQQIDTDVVIPIAVDRLVEEPLLEGDYYEGDVLEAALALPSERWEPHPEPRAALASALTQLVQSRPDDVDAELSTLIHAFLRTWG